MVYGISSSSSAETDKGTAVIKSNTLFLEEIQRRILLKEHSQGACASIFSPRNTSIMILNYSNLYREFATST